MGTFKIITSILITILPLTIIIRDWKYFDKRTRKHHNITRLIIVAWLLSSMLVAFFVLSDYNSMNELINGKNTLIKKINDLKKDNKMLINLNKEIKAEVNMYKSENERLKQTVNEISIKTFNIEKIEGGFRTYSEKSALNRKIDLAKNDFYEKKYDMAKNKLKIILEVDPNMVEALTLLGNIQFKQGNNKAAFISFEKAYNIRKDSITINNYEALKELITK